MMFENLGLSEPILRAVRAEGYQTATPIQVQAIPPLLDGHDLMGCAQTGTGKTAAFALPTLHRLSSTNKPSQESHVRDAQTRETQPRDPHSRQSRNGHRVHGRRKIRTLVLSPTRELAAQIGDSFAAYGKFAGLRHTVIYGGVGQGPQVRALRDGVDILIATPGRLLDLMQQGFVKLDAVEILILDEADQMLDMGFIQPLRRIVSHVPRNRQTLMFSATMPDEIRRLAAEWLREPVHVQVAPVATPAEKVQQSVFMVEVKHKPLLLAHFLQNTPNTRTLVFARTKHGADKIVKHLTRAGIYSAAIHGNKSQSVRQRVLQQFKSKRPPVLVATDIAARGLDIDDVSHVINYDLPEVPEIYVHRIGRTGRAGATGIAVSFCGREERSKLRGIERLTRRTIAVERHPDLPHIDQTQTSPRPKTNAPAQSPSRSARPAQSSGSETSKTAAPSQPAHDKPRSNRPARSKSRRFPKHGRRNAHTAFADRSQKRRRRPETAQR